MDERECADQKVSEDRAEQEKAEEAALEAASAQKLTEENCYNNRVLAQPQAEETAI